MREAVVVADSGDKITVRPSADGSVLVRVEQATGSGRVSFGIYDSRSVDAIVEALLTARHSASDLADAVEDGVPV